MPECAHCRKFDGATCTAKPAEWPDVPVNRIRACVAAICEEYCELITPEAKVLEIGCGTWSPIREHCSKIGAHWDGIDVSRFYYDTPIIATRIESVEDLSFPTCTFDLVIGNQTLEHWTEFGCRPERGLWQCFRVTKTGGSVLLNVPIHFHGARMFVQGDFDAISKLFEPFSYEVQFISWRRKSHPLPPANLIPQYQPSYNLDIRAVRNKELPPEPRPFRNRWRPVREFLDHSLPYLAWKAKEKMRLIVSNH
jgi:SAM-dependent methyltransferase